MQDIQERICFSLSLVINIQREPVSAVSSDINFPMKGRRGMKDWARSAEDKLFIPKEVFTLSSDGELEIWTSSRNKYFGQMFVKWFLSLYIEKKHRFDQRWLWLSLLPLFYPFTLFSLTNVSQMCICQHIFTSWSSYEDLNHPKVQNEKLIMLQRKRAKGEMKENGG